MMYMYDGRWNFQYILEPYCLHVGLLEFQDSMGADRLLFVVCSSAAVINNLSHQMYPAQKSDWRSK